MKWYRLPNGNHAGFDDPSQVPDGAVETDEAGLRAHLDYRSDESVAIEKRAARNKALSTTDWLVIRHRDEQEAGKATTLTDSEYAALQAHRAKLRDLTDHESWPQVDIPKAPV